MKNNEKNIPNYIFDWLEKYNFGSLKTSQKNEVLLYFSQEEYDELYQNMLVIKSQKITDSSIESENSKTYLLNTFENKYTKKTSKNILLTPIPIWKAAVVISVIGLSWIFSTLRQNNSDNFLNPVTLIDTVFIPKEIIVSVPEKIFDTIYIEKENPIKQQIKDAKKGKVVVNSTTHISQLNADVNIVSIKDLQSISNKQKGNSISEDSLIRNYNFVTL